MLALVQARMTSARLAGKVLRPMAGRPMLRWLLDNLAMSNNLSSIVVATSDQGSDDPISQFCAVEGVQCYRGSLDNVALRLVDAANSVNAPAFLRICGDSPLVDPTIIDLIVDRYLHSDVDLVTNVQSRTFPKGMSVEAIKLDALRRAIPLMALGEEEHVTQVFYRRSQDFRIVGVTSGHDWGAVQMSVDTPEDFAVVDRMLAAIKGGTQPKNLIELVALRERCAMELS